MDGASAAVAEPVAWGGLGQASLSACGSFPLAESLARGRVDFTATGEHTSGVESSQRGVEPVKFGRASRSRKRRRLPLMRAKGARKRWQQGQRTNRVLGSGAP